MLNTFPLLLTLPLTAEELSEYMDKFQSVVFAIDFKTSKKNLSNEEMLNYIANCNIKTVHLYNYEFDSEFENFIIEYARFDRELNIEPINETWTTILYYNRSNIVDEKYNAFIKNFRQKYPTLIEEADNFFYSMNRVVWASINENAVDIIEEVKKAKNNKLKFFGPNIVSFSKASNFWTYVAKLRKDEVYMYDEFVKPVIDGNTIISYFLNGYNPYKVYMIMDRTQKDPEFRETLQSEINKFNENIRVAKLNKNKENDGSNRDEEISIPTDFMSDEQASDRASNTSEDDK